MKNTIIFSVILVVAVVAIIWAFAIGLTLPFVISIIVGIVLALVGFKVADNGMGGKSPLAFGLIACGLGFFVMVFITTFLGSGLFTDSKRIEVANISTKLFSADKSVDEAQVVDVLMAQALAKTALGKKIDGSSVSTQFQLDLENTSLQNVKGELYWVFPLMHHSMLKAMKAPVVPAYVMVSATKGHQPAKVIEAKYQITSSGWFGKNLDRVGWELANLGLKTSHFEVDDNLVPHWVISAVSYKGFSSALSVDKVFVVNAMTGAAIGGTPIEITSSLKWVDEVVSLSIAQTRAEDIGAFENGWFNQSIFGSGEGESVLVKKPEPAFLKGRKYFVASMTSVSAADNSSTGLILVDAKTGVSTKIDIIGMSEDGALNAANSALGAESSRWGATNAQPVLVKNQWYWAVSIAATGSGLYQKAALVKMDDASLVVFGDTMKDAAAALESKISAKTVVSTKMSPKQKLIEIKNKMAELQKELDVVLTQIN